MATTGIPGSDSLSVLAAAVTPVVLVSATAILISGVNARFTAIADRMRTLTQEYREPHCTEERRAVIVQELSTFEHRMELASWALRGLYAATTCFMSIALIISATLWRNMLVGATVPLFFAGILLILLSITCQLLELHIANRTMAVEIRDIQKK